MKPLRPSEIKLRHDEAMDEFMDGRLKLIQFRKGYRFSIDAVLLAEFVTTKKGQTVVDLGTGCGIIPLLLLLTRRIRYVCCLEIQEDLASQAIRNACLNGFEHKMGVVLGDIKWPPIEPSSVEVVICNPPYRQVNSGRINPDVQRAIARHEMLASLDDILITSRRLLRPKGRLAIIYPAVRLTEVLVRMRGLELEPKRVRLIYPNLESDAKLVLIEACLGGQGGLEVLPPLIDQGGFSIGI